VSAALFALSAPIAHAYGEPGLTLPLRGIALTLLGQSMMMLFSALFVGLGRIALNFRTVLGESAVEATASIALVALGGGAAGAAFGRAAGYAAGALIGGLLVGRMLGRTALRPRRGGDEVHQIVRYAVPLLVVTSAYTMFSTTDVLLLGAFLGATAVGLFSAVMRLVTFLGYPGLAVANGVAPRVARGPRQAEGAAAFRRGLRVLTIYQALLLAPTIVWAEPIVVLLLGERYRAGADVLRIFAPFVFLRGLGPLITTSVNYLGQARRRVPITVGMLALNIGLGVTLIPWLGIEGAAISTTVPYCLYVPAHLSICARELGLERRRLGATVARAALAATAMAVVLAAAGTSSLTPAEWIWGGTGGALAFLAVLLATGELSVNDLRSARRVVRRRLLRAEVRV
jgi:O-antigen/teichoic acid export membrane protein